MNNNNKISILNNSDNIAKVDYSKIDALAHQKLIINGVELVLSSSINIFYLENRTSTVQKLNELGDEI